MHFFGKNMAKRTFFSDREQNLLKELVNDRINIVESKKTDFKALSAKKKVWFDICKDFNAFDNVAQRTEKQLKKCWDNMKTRAKTKVAMERRERLLTGGGKVLPTADDTDRQVQAMVAPQIEPMRNPFDGDACQDDLEGTVTADEDSDDISTSRTSPPCRSISAASGSGTTPKVTVAQQKVLDRQELEHQTRMKLMKRELEMAEERHQLQMQILRLKHKKLQEAASSSSTCSIASASPQTGTRMPVRKSCFSIDSLVNDR